MIKNRNETSAAMDKALKNLEQAKARYEAERKKENEKRRKAQNHHKYLMGGIVAKYFPECYQYEEKELNVILSAALASAECRQAVENVPGMMLTNIFSRIVSLNQAGHGSGEDNSDEIMDILRDSTLEITAELGRTEVKLQDAYFLNIGDVIDLGHPKDEPIYLYIGGKPWFGGKLGVQNNSMAVKIGENYYNEGRRDE